MPAARGGEPQRKITPADHARAASMLVGKRDLGAAFGAAPTSGGLGSFSCSAPGTSDLTLTGEAESPTYGAATAFVASTALVLESKADADPVWGRGTSAAGLACLRSEVRSALRGTNVRLVSLGTIAFPKCGRRSVAYRAVETRQGFRLDLVAMEHERARAVVAYGSALSPPARVETGRPASSPGAWRGRCAAPPEGRRLATGGELGRMAREDTAGAAVVGMRIRW